MKNHDVLINRIKVDLNHDAIQNDFVFVRIETKLSQKANYRRVVSEIYEKLSPLALCKPEENVFVALLRKGGQYSFDNPNNAFSLIQSNEVDAVNCARLLVRSLPHISDEMTRFSEGVGLFYISRVEKIRDVEVLRAFQINIEREANNHLVLAISGTTFTPITYHVDENGELNKKCRHLLRVMYNQDRDVLTVSSKGNYIKKKHRVRKMTSEMVSLDTKNPSKFWISKMGVLKRFMDDMQLYMSDYIAIKFDEISPEPLQRRYFKERYVSDAYKKIGDFLSREVFNIVNFTNVDVSHLVMKLKSEGFKVKDSKSADERSLNLIIHYEKEYYEDRNLDDPYAVVRSQNNGVFQSVYPDSIFKNEQVVDAVYEACKKELFIKMEILRNRFLLTRLKGNWRFVLCEATKDNDPVYHCLDASQDILAYSALSIEEAQDSFLEELPRTLSLNGQKAVINLDTNESYVIEETKYVAMPRYKELAKIMKELEIGYENGIKTDWIKEFIETLDSGDAGSEQDPLIKSLEKLLKANSAKDTVFKNDIFKSPGNKISYRGKFQAFFDWVTIEKGMRLGASLKRRDDGYIDAGVGLFYNRDEMLYFVGSKNNVKTLPNFCRIRRIVTRSSTVPAELLDMMEAFHIRHKQATVLPFPFKHLREYIDTQSGSLVS